MFLDIRVTLATFCTAIGLALVMFAVGTRAWVGVDSERPAAPRFEARALAAPVPTERGFGVGSVGASPGASATAPVTMQNFLPPKAEPVRPAERVTSRETPAPSLPSSVMPGAGAVVQERFDVLHEPAGQIVAPRGPIAASVGGPLVPLPRPRSSEAAAAPTTASIAGSEQADARPKATLGSTKRAETPAKKRPPRQTATSYFGSLFGR
jgi:hypothetical protein